MLCMYPNVPITSQHFRFFRWLKDKEINKIARDFYFSILFACIICLFPVFIWLLQNFYIVLIENRVNKYFFRNRFGFKINGDLQQFMGFWCLLNKFLGYGDESWGVYLILMESFEIKILFNKSVRDFLTNLLYHLT